MLKDKKIISRVKKILLMTCVLLGISTVGAFAKDALYSDIGTYINNYPISGYAVDGKIVVVAEDLREYGFNVEWSEADRALYISRDESVSALVKRDVYKTKYASGTKFSDVYPTDIKVYYNNIKMESYAINGYTLIPLNDLATLAGSEEWIADARTYKVWIDDLSVCEYAPMQERTVNLWYSPNSYPSRKMPSFAYNADMDSDEKLETVKLTIDGYDQNNNILLSLAVDDAVLNDIAPEWSFDVDAVYLTDLIPNDGAKEVAVFFQCDSDDPEMKIFRYRDGGLTALRFVETEYTSDSLYTGNCENFLFDVHDDGSFTLVTRSQHTNGMWLVYVNYISDEWDNVFLVPQAQYTVAEEWGYKNAQGYSPVYKTFLNGGVPLYQGDWIKIIADDMNGKVLIQKSNGQTGWFYVGTHTDYDYMFDYLREVQTISPLFGMAG